MAHAGAAVGSRGSPSLSGDPRLRIAILALSACAIFVGVGWDAVRGGEPGFGPLQIQLCAVGLAGALLALLPGELRGPYARGLFAIGVAYLSALAFELVLMPPRVHTGLAQTSEQGLVQPSSWGGYELTPGWRGHYDDGVDRVDIAINTLGDRDDTPAPADAAAERRILLLGDSFTFGVGLQKSQTIEAQLEAATGGRAVAYNLGVGGYGPGDTLEHYRERPWFPATDTFFLLYGNDLRVDNCTAGYHTAVDGVIVPRAGPGAVPYGPADVERELAAARKQDARLWYAQLRNALSLTELRGRLTRLLGREVPLAAGAPERFTRECALAAAARADEMRELARARNQRFAVVILPTAAEAQSGRYFELMQLCIDELRRRSIPVLEVRDRLTLHDYFRHHEHLNAVGARKVAHAILAHATSEERGVPGADVARTGRVEH
jgi:hypothetical protein